MTPVVELTNLITALSKCLHVYYLLRGKKNCFREINRTTSDGAKWYNILFLYPNKIGHKLHILYTGYNYIMLGVIK